MNQVRVIPVLAVPDKRCTGGLSGICRYVHRAHASSNMLAEML